MLNGGAENVTLGVGFTQIDSPSMALSHARAIVADKGYARKTSIFIDVKVASPLVRVSLKTKVRVEEPVRLYTCMLVDLEKFNYGPLGENLAPVDLLAWDPGNFCLRVARYSGAIMQ